MYGYQNNSCLSTVTFLTHARTHAHTHTRFFEKFKLQSRLGIIGIQRKRHDALVMLYYNTGIIKYLASCLNNIIGRILNWQISVLYGKKPTLAV